MSLSDDDRDLLADLLAGEGTDEQVARVEASPDLAQALADLEAAQQRVAGDLAALAGADAAPPAGFAERLAAALAAEAGTPARSRPRVGSAVDDDPADDPADDLGGRRARHSSRARRPPARARSPWVLRAAAGLVALAVLAGVGVALSRSDDDSGTITSASAAGSVPTTSSGRDYRSTGSLSAALPSLLGATQSQGRAAERSADAATRAATTGGVAEAPVGAADSPTATTRSGSGVGGSTSGGATSGGSTTGGTTSATSTTGSAVQPGADPLSASGGVTAPVAPQAGTPDSAAAAALDRLRGADGLRACYAALELPADTTPLALDYAAWRGEPALVILLPVAARPEQVEAYVVGAGCGAGTDALLFFGRLDRP